MQLVLKKRSPKVTHPRRIGSDYLLSGLLHCGKCGAAMVGCSAKSSQFSYYSCHRKRSSGQDLCDAKMLNRDRLDAYVIERLKTRILTEENLTELVRLTNEEIGRERGEYEERVAAVNGQLEKLRRRLDRLYDALETGKLEPEDLAPRIRELRARADSLERTRADLVDTTDNSRAYRLEASVI